MNESTSSPLNFMYLAKVSCGLITVGSVILLGLSLGWLNVANSLRIAIFSIVALAVLAIVPFAAWAYKRQDEFHRFIHQLASIRTLPWLVATFGLAGALQAMHVLPEFNQFLTMVVVIAVWGLQLMLADRRAR